MSSFYQKSLTRRSAIAGALAALPMLRLGEVQANQYEPIQPVDLGHGLEVRDYRLFPTDDVMRFIVEIHNYGDTAVDTPAVGVVLPDVDEIDNFGWAVPVGTVVQSGMSEMLIGIAPGAITSDKDWNQSEWMPCSEIDTEKAVELGKANIEFSHELEILSETHARAHLNVTNNGDTVARSVFIQGLVRDSDGRICGTTLRSSVQHIRPDDNDQQIVNIVPAATYTTNPFVLIDTTDGLDASFSLQPQTSIMNPRCPSVLPW